MKILVDMNLSPKWAAALASYDFEVMHWSAAGTTDASDAGIVEYARDHGYTILTHDLDLGAMLAAGHGGKPSQIHLRAGDIRPDDVAPLVAGSLRQAFAEIEAGAILTIEPDKARLRVLPLR